MAAMTTLKNSESSRIHIVQIVARNTAFMLGGQILIKLFAFVFSIFVIRHLGADQFGQYAAALAYVSIFAMLTDLGTSTLSIREMARKPENTAWMVPAIISLRAILSLGAIGVIVLSAWMLGKPTIEILGIFIASCGLLLYAFQGPLDSVMVSQERLDFAAVLNLIEKMLFMLLGAVFLWLGWGYIGLLIAMLAGVCVSAVSLWLVTRYTLHLHFLRPDPRRWWPLLRASFPFGITGAAREFARRFDTVFMSFVLTSAAVGWYNVPYNMLTTLLVMAQSLAMSIYPTMVREYNSGMGSIEYTVQRALRYLLLLSVPIAVGGGLLAERIILVLYGLPFAPSIPVMQLMVWVLPLLFISELLGRTANTLHLEDRVARMSIVMAIVNVGLNIVLITYLGVIGAVITMLLTRLIYMVLMVLIIGPDLLFSHNVLPLLRVVAAGTLMGVCVWFACHVPFITALPAIPELVVLVALGMLVYGIAIFMLGAVSRSETRYMYTIIRYSFQHIFRKRDTACVS